MSALLDQLRRLRRDAGVAPRAPAADALESLAALRRLAAGRERRHRAALVPPAGEEIAPGLRLVRRSQPWPAAAQIHVPLDGGSVIERRRLLAFDTETTGLAGGVGTRAFMIGVAAWQAGVLETRQLYLTATAGEAAMLEAFAGWLDADTILVSYNGKSYDAPLLKGRYRLNRIAHRLDDLPHLDWLHPVRRRYRASLPNCRLATIEREVLRILREDDLPGSEAPAAWLSYLRGECAGNLGRVLEHNRQDVISLVRLGEHMEAIEGEAARQPPATPEAWLP